MPCPERATGKFPSKEWRTTGKIEGYASASSVNVGEGITFYVSIKNLATHYDIRIYRLGWYDGDGGRLIAEKLNRVGTPQAMPDANHTTGLAECSWILPGGFAQNTWIASGAPSGYYLAKITTIGAVENPNLPPGEQGSRVFESYVPFVVREDARASDFLFQASVTTWQAYNFWPADQGETNWKSGKSLYAGGARRGRLSWGPKVPDTDPDFAEVQARKVSFNRPYFPDNGIYGTAGKLFFWGEYNMARWMEHEGYDVTYTTDVDTDAASDLENGPLRPGHHKVFLSVGHDEYWSWKMRDNIEKARNRPTQPLNIGWFGGNNVHWQIRFENSSSPNSSPPDVPKRTMVAYKHLATSERPFIRDPNFVPLTQGGSENNYLTTTLWRDNNNSTTLGSTCPQNVQNCFKPPEDELVGVMTTTPNTVTGRGDFNFYTGGDDEDDPPFPAWILGDITNLNAIPNLVGYEADEIFDSPYNDPDTGDRWFWQLGDSTLYSNPGEPPGSTLSHAVFYKLKGSGPRARVFAAGTISWTWGLDDWGGPGGSGPALYGHPYTYDARVETMTRNILTCLRDGGACDQPPPE